MPERKNTMQRTDCRHFHYVGCKMSFILSLPWRIIATALEHRDPTSLSFFSPFTNLLHFPCIASIYLLESLKSAMLLKLLDMSGYFFWNIMSNVKNYNSISRYLQVQTYLQVNFSYSNLCLILQSKVSCKFWAKTTTGLKSNFKTKKIFYIFC